jgi:hypothetical protein
MSTAAAAQGTAAAEVAAAAVAVPVPVAAPAAAPAGAAVVPEPSDAPGISQEQLRVWREKFAELMHSGDTVPAGTYIQYCAAASLCLSLPLSAAAAF